VRELMRRFGSPLFILDAQKVDRQASALTSVFRPPRYRLYYAVKANPRVAVVRRLIRHGFGCDATGIGDVKIALAAGCDPGAISVTGVGLSAEEIEQLLAWGLCPNVDSIDELSLLCALCPGGTVGLRINPGVCAGFHPHVVAGKRGGKLGIDLDDLPGALEIVRGARVLVRTLHTHLGSLIQEFDPFITACELLLRLASRLPSVTTVNLGGGFGIPYEPDTPTFPFDRLEGALRARIDAFEDATGRRLTVALEPGEFLVGPAGYLAATVRVSKPSSRTAIVDASANLLPAVLLYGLPYDAAVLPVSASHGDEREWTVCGRTNQGEETLAAGSTLPLQRGDILLFSMVGAYTSCRASQFNQLPRPAEIMVDGGQIEIAQVAEDLQDLLRPPSDGGPRAGSSRAGMVGLDTESLQPGRVDYGYSIDDEQHSLSIQFRELAIRLDERERGVLAGAVAVLIAQLVLAEKLALKTPLSPELISSLRPCLQLLYDVRSYCDGRERLPLPEIHNGMLRINDIRCYCDGVGLPAIQGLVPTGNNSGSQGTGTLVALSGGFDSTLLLRLASRCPEPVEAIHFRINETVRDEEERAARAIAKTCGVRLHIVDIEIPGLVDLGRRHSTSFAHFPRYNAVPHGRDLLLLPLAVIVAKRLGLGRVAFGFDREARHERMDYRGVTIHRNDFASAYGFELVADLLREHLDPEIAIEAPLWALSGYRIRRTVLAHFPELAAEIQTCYWNRWCERCVKCVTTSLLQEDLKRQQVRYRSDMLDDPQNEYLTALFAQGTRAAGAYWELSVHILDRLARTDPDRLWVRRFAESFRDEQQETVRAAQELCEAVELPVLVERFGPGVSELIDIE